MSNSSELPPYIRGVNNTSSGNPMTSGGPIIIKRITLSPKQPPNNNATRPPTANTNPPPPSDIPTEQKQDALYSPPDPSGSQSNTSLLPQPSTIPKDDNGILVMSDPEGFDYMTLLPEDSGNKTVCICGDLFDSTATVETTLINDENLFKRKSNNIKNVFNVLNNNKHYLAFGNRDVNKGKIRLLGQLKNENNVNNYNEGLDLVFTEDITGINQQNNNLLNEAYDAIKLKIGKDTNPWVVENMNNWYTFWSGAVTTGRDWTTTWDKYNYNKHHYNK